MYTRKPFKQSSLCETSRRFLKPTRNWRRTWSVRRWRPRQNTGQQRMVRGMINSLFLRYLGSVSIWRPSFLGMGIPMLKIRRSQDRLIFNMGILTLVRRHLYIQMPPGCDFIGEFFKVISQIDVRALPVKLLSGECHRNPNNVKSALLQVMAWCCQATSHYLSQWNNNPLPEPMLNQIYVAIWHRYLHQLVKLEFSTKTNVSHFHC